MPNKHTNDHVHQQQIFTCPMHPQIQKNEPGACPICHMDLVLLQSDSKKTDGDEIRLTLRQQLLANIKVDTVRNGQLSVKMGFNGQLVLDQSLVSVESARIAGRIDKLYIKSIGEYVRKGAALYDLYSEELNTAQSEYVLALSSVGVLQDEALAIQAQSVVMSAKNKLKLWGMTDAQIQHLTQTKSVSNHITVYSRNSGYTSDLFVAEGSYVEEGSKILELADMSRLWAEAQVYTSQLAAFKENDEAFVEIPALQIPAIKTKIAFAYPEIANSATGIQVLRMSVPNIQGKLKAGMSLYISINKGKREGLFIPIDAVIRDGENSKVWIQSARGVFKSVDVRLGDESDFEIEIVEGLREGDQVVVSGAYLLHSEYVLKHSADE